MSPAHKVAVLETCHAAPPPTTVSDFSLPLTFSDLMWLLMSSPIQRLIFYKSSISNNHFIDSIVPKLKNSLSLTLQKFPSLAGRLIIPQDSSRAEIQYSNGDSVPLLFAEDRFSDFDDLVSDKPRDCNEFYAFLPQLQQSFKVSGTTKLPLLSLQVTLFPDTGICIGISNQHVGGDGSSMYAFVKAWAEISRLGEEAKLGDEYVPLYDRSVMTKHTKELDDMFRKFVRDGLDNDRVVLDKPHGLPDDADRARATFVFELDDIKRLKNYVSAQKSGLKHLSTFTVVCGYIWICLVKAGNAISATPVDDAELEYFGSVADCRGRTDPPIPSNYFGNCLTYFFTEAKNSEISTGVEWLPTAAEQIGEAIHHRLQSKEGPFKELGKMFGKFSSMDIARVLSVAGSPRQNYYIMDFGWGKPRKFEFVSIDSTEALSLSGSRAPGGVEVGLSMPKAKMDAFVSIFKEGLKAL